MDLLNAYGSSDEEEEEVTMQSEENGPGAAAAKASSTSNSSSKALKRGKKMLSLQAVLPPHIYDQLTNSQYANQDEEEDEDDDKAQSNFYKSTRNEKSDNPKRQQSSKDPGVSRLLQALQSTSVAESKSNSSSKPKKQQQQQQQHESLPLGNAFLSSATTTIITKKGSNVRDIHAEAPVEANQPAVETVMDEEEEEEEEDIPVQNDRVDTTKQPAKAPPRTSRVQAAPRVAPQVASQTQQSFSAGASASSLSQQQQQQPPTKRSRKEMERMLRHGMLNQAMQERDMTSVEQEAPHDFVPEVPAEVPTHGVRNVPTQMYDPSSGATTTGVRGRGKNQINHLLGQAASLELARARGMAGSSNNTGTAHRSNAKRKYGW